MASNFDFAARLAQCPGISKDAVMGLSRYFIAVNSSTLTREDKLQAVVASFEHDATVTTSGKTTTPTGFYDSPASPVLRIGFRAEPNYSSLMCSADGRSIAISIKLVPAGREDDAFLVGDWFTFGDSGYIKHLLIHGPPPSLTTPAADGKRMRSDGEQIPVAMKPRGRTIELRCAKPYSYTFPLESTALILIDFQRDFLLPGGFGASLGNDVSLLVRAVAPARAALKWARSSGLHIVHTREGHLPDLTDLKPSKLRRGNPPPGKRIGDDGAMGRILVDGEYGCSIVQELAPIDTELDLLKPGKGAFWNTKLEAWLRERGISHLLIGGVTTEVCVQTTMREANDRGFDCCILEDATASYFPEFHTQALDMIRAQGGIVGWTSTTAELIASLG